MTGKQMTVEQLRDWMNTVRQPYGLEEIRPGVPEIKRVGEPTFPPCPGCRADVHRASASGPAPVQVDLAAQTATFRPCGCVVSIHRPQGLRDRAVQG